MLDLDGFRFYGCSLLLIYDGDKDAQEHYTKHARSTIPGAGPGRLGVLEEEDEWVDIRHRPSRSRAPNPDEEIEEEEHRARRSKSVDIHPSSTRRHRRSSSRKANQHSHGRNESTTGPPKKLRGEVNIRVVDFAHTTTGLDFIPFPPGYTEPDEKTLGKGYESQIDPASGLNLARFPPKHPLEPDMGFIYGLQSVCSALTGVWEEEVGEEVVRGWVEGMENKDVFEKAFPNGAGAEDGEVST
jgi:hypothetical protein